MSADGEADYDTLLGMLPPQFQERAGKMIDKCRHISKYTCTLLSVLLVFCPPLRIQLLMGNPEGNKPLERPRRRVENIKIEERRHLLLKEPHGLTSQKTPFFIVIAVKTSNLT
jgi:hypothetical protein